MAIGRCSFPQDAADPQRPKKGPSAYQRYSKAVREATKAELPEGAGLGDVSKALSKKPVALPSSRFAELALMRSAFFVPGQAIFPDRRDVGLPNSPGPQRLPRRPAHGDPREFCGVTHALLRGWHRRGKL